MRLIILLFLIILANQVNAKNFIVDSLYSSSEMMNFDPNRDAEGDIKLAILQAKKFNKRILLYVGGEWCGWCKRLDKFFQENQDVSEFLFQNYVIVKVNYSKENKNEKVLSKFSKIKAYPHFFVLDKNGRLIHSQDTGELEYEDGYSKEKIVKFLAKFTKNKLR